MVRIYVYADWRELRGPALMGELTAESVRGKEVFSFSYDRDWLRHEGARTLDPDLRLYGGYQYVRDEKANLVSSRTLPPTAGAGSSCSAGKHLKQNRKVVNLGPFWKATT
ncbi:MAG TPA: hypothetical protein VGM31_08800 [Puia sp.]